MILVESKQGGNGETPYEDTIMTHLCLAVVAVAQVEDINTTIDGPLEDDGTCVSGGTGGTNSNIDIIQNLWNVR